MEFNTKVALEKLVYAMSVNKQTIKRTFLTEVWMHVDPQPDYGTNTKMGKEMTSFMKEQAAIYNAQYVKDANGKGARIEFI